jgi:Lsr2
VSKETIVRDNLTRRIAAETTEVTVTFDGEDFIVDLTDESKSALRAMFANADNEQLRKLVAPLVQKTEPAQEPAKPKRASSANGETSKVRQWGREHGFDVSDRGKLSKELRNAYAEQN